MRVTSSTVYELVPVDTGRPSVLPRISLRAGDELVSVGRGRICDVVIPVRHLSSRHCTIRVRHTTDSHYVVLTDESTNGCQISGKPIPKNTDVKLKHGDVITLSSANAGYPALLYKFHETSAPKGPTSGQVGRASPAESILPVQVPLPQATESLMNTSAKSQPPLDVGGGGTQLSVQPPQDRADRTCGSETNEVTGSGGDAVMPGMTESSRCSHPYPATVNTDSEAMGYENGTPVFELSPGNPSLMPQPFHFGEGDALYVLGRSPTADFVVSAPEVSGKHMLFQVAKKGTDKPFRVYVTDTSTNGTFLNNKRLAPRVPVILRPGDQLSLFPSGDIATRFSLIFVDHRHLATASVQAPIEQKSEGEIRTRTPHESAPVPTLDEPRTPSVHDRSTPAATVPVPDRTTGGVERHPAPTVDMYSDEEFSVFDSSSTEDDQVQGKTSLPGHVLLKSHGVRAAPHRANLERNSTLSRWSNNSCEPASTTAVQLWEFFLENLPADISGTELNLPQLDSEEHCVSVGVLEYPSFGPSLFESLYESFLDKLILCLPRGTLFDLVGVSTGLQVADDEWLTSPAPWKNMSVLREGSVVQTSPLPARLDTTLAMAQSLHGVVALLDGQNENHLVHEATPTSYDHAFVNFARSHYPWLRDSIQSWGPVPPLKPLFLDAAACGGQLRAPPVLLVTGPSRSIKDADRMCSLLQPTPLAPSVREMGPSNNAATVLMSSVVNTAVSAATAMAPPGTSFSGTLGDELGALQRDVVAQLSAESTGDHLVAQLSAQPSQPVSVVHGPHVAEMNGQIIKWAQSRAQQSGHVFMYSCSAYPAARQGVCLLLSIIEWIRDSFQLSLDVPITELSLRKQFSRWLEVGACATEKPITLIILNAELLEWSLNGDSSVSQWSNWFPANIPTQTRFILSLRSDSSATASILQETTLRYGHEALYIFDALPQSTLQRIVRTAIIESRFARELPSDSLIDSIADDVRLWPQEAVQLFLMYLWQGSQTTLPTNLTMQTFCRVINDILILVENHTEREVIEAVCAALSLCTVGLSKLELFEFYRRVSSSSRTLASRFAFERAFIPLRGLLCMQHGLYRPRTPLIRDVMRNRFMDSQSKRCSTSIALEAVLMRFMSVSSPSERQIIELVGAHVQAEQWRSLSRFLSKLDTLSVLSDSSNMTRELVVGAFISCGNHGYNPVQCFLEDVLPSEHFRQFPPSYQMDILRYLAQLSQLSCEWSQAELLWTLILERSSDSSVSLQAREELALIALGSGDHRRGEVHLEEALDIANENDLDCLTITRLTLLLAPVLLALNEPEEASNLLRQQLGCLGDYSGSSNDLLLCRLTLTRQLCRQHVGSDSAALLWRLCEPALKELEGQPHWRFWVPAIDIVHSLLGAQVNPELVAPYLSSLYQAILTKMGRTHQLALIMENIQAYCEVSRTHPVPVNEVVQPTGFFQCTLAFNEVVKTGTFGDEQSEHILQCMLDQLQDDTDSSLFSHRIDLLSGLMVWCTKNGNWELGRRYLDLLPAQDMLSRNRDVLRLSSQVQLWVQMGTFHVKDGDLSQAANCLSQAAAVASLDHSPSNASPEEFHLVAARLWLRAGSWKNAHEHFRFVYRDMDQDSATGMAYSPGYSSDCMLEYASMLLVDGDSCEALKVLQIASELHNQYRTTLSQSQFHYLTFALKLTFAHAYRIRGEIPAALQSASSAQAFLESVSQQDTRLSPSATLQLCIFWINSGLNFSAAESLLQSLMDDPNLEPGLIADALILYASLKRATGRDSESMQLLRRALKLLSQAEFALDKALGLTILGAVELQESNPRPDEALVHLRHSLTIQQAQSSSKDTPKESRSWSGHSSGTDPVVRTQLRATCSYSLGVLDTALGVYDRALTHYSETLSHMTKETSIPDILSLSSTIALAYARCMHAKGAPNVVGTSIEDVSAAVDAALSAFESLSYSASQRLVVRSTPEALEIGRVLLSIIQVCRRGRNSSALRQTLATIASSSPSIQNLGSKSSQGDQNGLLNSEGQGNKEIEEKVRPHGDDGDNDNSYEYTKEYVTDCREEEQ